MDIQYIVVHCSATQSAHDIGVTEINKWHKARGWSGIGYHFVIRRSGVIEQGRQMSKVGAHAYGFNQVSWGVCLVGGVDSDNNSTDNFTDEQMDALEDLLNVLRRMEPKAKIVGHRDLSPDINGDGVISKWEWRKDCPCFDVEDFIKDRGIVWTKKKYVLWPF